MFTCAPGVDLRRALVDGLASVGSYAAYIVQTIVTLVAVCALAFLVLYGARRLGIGRPRGPIELVGLLPLDARRAIYLVKVAGQVIVVGASEAGFTKLGELPAGELPAEEKADSPGFADVLARIPSTAGLHLAAWARSDDADVGGWRDRAAERGVALSAVQDYATRPRRPGLVFGFGAIPEEKVAPGLARLRIAIDA